MSDSGDVRAGAGGDGAGGGGSAGVGGPGAAAGAGGGGGVGGPGAAAGEPAPQRAASVDAGRHVAGATGENNKAAWVRGPRTDGGERP